MPVDPGTSASPVAPPAGLYSGESIAAPGEDPAPAIFVYGAELVRVPAATRVVRPIVFSSGAGRLRAAAAGKLLGTAVLRPGNNDVRFKLPASLASAAARRTLT